MSNLKKELIKEIIADGGFSNSIDIGNYLRDIFKDVLQEMLEQELSSQLGYEKGDSLNKNTSNRRNGHSKKLLNHNTEISSWIYQEIDKVTLS